ncbi:MAG: hypothetical protein ACKOXB_02440 [Flavobacteriales bacterium]
MEIKNKKQELSELLGKISKVGTYEELIAVAQNIVTLASEIKTAEVLKKDFDAQIGQMESSFAEQLKAATVVEIKPEPIKITEPEKIAEPEIKVEIQPEIVTQKTFEKPARAATISEKMESPVDKTLAGKFRKSPIADLVKAVNINQKILFTRELFKGDSFAFNDALSKLNSFQNKDEALGFLKTDLQSKHSWKEGSAALSEFTELVERRYV